ncbi:hypothetical protein LguiB_028005 [Lonicera macranthoides]
MYKKKEGAKGGSSASDMDLKDQRLDLKSILKDIEFLGSSHMTWKERKELENKKVVSLGGKPPKKHRFPLSVARAAMKNQKKREEKMQQENLILGRFHGRLDNGNKIGGDKRKPENRVLKSTAGSFRNGILDVKHLLHSSAPRDGGDVTNHAVFNKGKKKKGGKKNKGKKGGGGRGKRH